MQYEKKTVANNFVIKKKSTIMSIKCQITKGVQETTNSDHRFILITFK